MIIGKSFYYYSDCKKRVSEISIDSVIRCFNNKLTNVYSNLYSIVRLSPNCVI